MRQGIRRPAATSAALVYVVVWSQAAVVELNAVRATKDRLRILTVAEQLRQVGPKLVEPHRKKVRGHQKLFELRPGGGKVLFRPLVARVDERTFVVLAIAPEAMTDGPGFRSACVRARDRALTDHGLIV